MFKAFLDQLKTRRESTLPFERTDTQVRSQTAVVEEIWSSWRYGKQGPSSPATPAPAPSAEAPPSSSAEARLKTSNAAELVNQLKRRGEYDEALRLALSEIKDEEKSGPRGGGRQLVPWYYWEAASIYRKQKRYEDEIALIHRFARNHDISFRAFSRRYRSKVSTSEIWAAKFLDRIEAARSALAQARDKH
ncbi:hypothetical protein JQ554_06360 [Bradyrhizobium diazoefficiens]|jgi:hypothetical protein|nr:hypothetical protein [Bradyrhizobium diazoefficiens]UCF51647.1 MAG: hypothetical protein JSV48_19865 [Bradyrhizobium sp.]MBR0963720.1 hypothetical protein [Bradyrhizobium diazoefficiens]MBR0977872.1 hypothetical protein [Bradyrhizobium diazoefficiens]MBR1007382.1 hypothetical protein [Bradyrhizobium diazoefficiens]MBR1012777.1 hypothetical protein [Bradyrhizobium diazoefficiens]